MPLSYEFEGHYLPDWAEFGGLPVWNCHAEEEMGMPPQAEKLIAVVKHKSTSTYYLMESGWVYVETGGPIRLRYSQLEDVVDQKPEWAKWLYVYKNGKIWFCEHKPKILAEKYDVICGYGKWHETKKGLLNPDDYPEPVEL